MNAKVKRLYQAGRSFDVMQLRMTRTYACAACGRAPFGMHINLVRSAEHRTERVRIRIRRFHCAGEQVFEFSSI